MKYYLMLIFIVIFYGCHPIIFKSTWDLDNIPRGKPKKLEILIYSYNLRNDSIVEKKLVSKKVYTYTTKKQILSYKNYDSKGNLINYSREYNYLSSKMANELVYYGTNKNPEIVRVNSYNNKKQIIKCVSKNNNNNETITSSFIYGKSNSSITKITTFKNGKFNKEIYSYDNKKRIIKHQFFDENGNYHDGIDFFYNDKNNSSIENWYYSEGKLMLNIRNKYNEFGDVFLVEEFDVEGKDTITRYKIECVSMIYDKRKNLIKQITKENGKPYQIIDYNYTYY